MLHPAGQASCLPSCHIQGCFEMPCLISIGQEVTFLSALLFLLTPHPHHPHWLWVESRHMAHQQQTPRPRTGATGQPGLGLHCIQQGINKTCGENCASGVADVLTGSCFPHVHLEVKSPGRFDPFVSPCPGDPSLIPAPHKFLTLL